jgi:hypothetical protein
VTSIRVTSANWREVRESHLFEECSMEEDKWSSRKEELLLVLWRCILHYKKLQNFLIWAFIVSAIGQGRYLTQIFIQINMAVAGKVVFARFHIFRTFKFAAIDILRMKALLWISVKQNPTQKLADYVKELSKQGFNVSREFVRRIFVSWRWSWKKPSFKQLAKYSRKNVEYYHSFLSWIVLQDLHKIKFMDEVHFVAKGTSITLFN